MSVRIASWNVNGLRSVATKGFGAWLANSGAEIVGVQEVRAQHEQLPPELGAPDGWHVHIVAAAKAGYSGVGLFARRVPDQLETSLGVRTLDSEGRMQWARFGAVTVVNCYFPNGNGKERDNSRIPYKLRFTRRVFARLEALRLLNERVIVMGDFNTAPEDVDLARPRENRETSGFTAIERKEAARWRRAGWIDTFRHFEKGAGHYTWWSQRFGVRERNIGWRIDHILVSPALLPFLRNASIHRDVRGSDHCPVSVDIDRAAF